METKRCTKCGVEKPRTEFRKNNSSKDGLRSDCIECKNAANREHYAANREHYRAYRAKNAERRSDQFRAWFEKRRADHAAWMREWRKKNPELVRQIRDRNRAKRLAAEGSYSAQEWRELCRKYDNRCLACGSTASLTPDHVVPLSRRGTNTIDNIQPLCFNCNRRKSTRVVDYRVRV